MTRGSPLDTPRAFCKEPKSYGTTLDQFREREGLTVSGWAREAGMQRSQLNLYRIEACEPEVSQLARLVRAASRLRKRPVLAAEIADTGEDEPLGPTKSHLAPTPTRRPHRKNYDTRLDGTLRRLNVSPTRLALEIEVSRQALRKWRGGADLRLDNLRLIVRTLRRHGYDVHARDIADVGED